MPLRWPVICPARFERPLLFGTTGRLGVDNFVVAHRVKIVQAGGLTKTVATIKGTGGLVLRAGRGLGIDLPSAIVVYEFLCAQQQTVANPLPLIHGSDHDTVQVETGLGARY